MVGSIPHGSTTKGIFGGPTHFRVLVLVHLGRPVDPKNVGRLFGSLADVDVLTKFRPFDSAMHLYNEPKHFPSPPPWPP
jgi:hypothetical protein